MATYFNKSLRRRKLQYNTEECQVGRAKQMKYGGSCQQISRAWQRRMDGFDGFDWTSTGQTKVDQKAEVGCSQVDISWSSDEGSEPALNCDDEEDDVYESSVYIDSSDDVSNHGSAFKLKSAVLPAECTLPNELHNTAISEFDSGSENEGTSLAQQEYQERHTTSSAGKVSDWMKCLQTPEKINCCEDEPTVEDSAKKQQKFKKSGLADRLLRLIAREKAAVTFWSHRKNDDVSSDYDLTKAPMVKVLKCWSESSLFVAHCRPLHSSHQDSKETASDKADYWHVLFHGSSKDIAPGNVVRIFPPWQKLNAPDGGVVLLCTNFHRFVRRDTSFMPDDEQLMSKVIARWACPCSTDPSISHGRCPAHKCPCKTDITIPQLSGGTTHLMKGTSKTLLLESSVPQQSHLATGGCTSILESVENQGHCAGVGISFVARVQRVFCRNCVSGRKQWTVLLQDSHGAVCELQLPPGVCAQHAEQPAVQREDADWLELLNSGEGRLYSFTQLRLMHRTNKSRSAALFSVIESAWSSEGIMARNESQDSEQEPRTSSLHSEPPGFCYVASTVSGESRCSHVMHATSAATYRPACVTRLADVFGDGNMPQSRVTLIVKVIFFLAPESPDELSVVYITDASLRRLDVGPVNTYRRLLITQTAAIPEHLRVFAEDNVGKDDTFIFRDVHCYSGNLYVDNYSRIFYTKFRQNARGVIVENDTIASVEALSFTPEALRHDVRKGDLVSVQGGIKGIDESTAFVWDECDVCGNEDIIKTNMSCFLYCDKCGKEVTEPVRRLRLDVILSCHDMDTDMTITLKLSQPTIEALLPEEIDEEGYEIQSILGRHVGPVSALVTAVIDDGSCTHLKLHQMPP